MTVKATTPAIMHQRSSLQQMDLFRAGVADGAPEWTELPEDARDALDQPYDAVDPEACTNEPSAVRSGGRP